MAMVYNVFSTRGPSGVLDDIRPITRTEGGRDPPDQGGEDEHGTPTDLGSRWGGPGPLLHLDPGLRVQVGQAGGEALGHGLQV